MTLPLFDTRPVALAREAEPTAADSIAADSIAATAGDVQRVITHKAGPMREIVEGAATGREFVILELIDGRFVRQFADGRRERATPATTRVMIDDAIRAGVFIEVVI